MSVERHTQDLPDDLAYLVEVQDTREWAIENPGTERGKWNMENGEWWSVKDEGDPYNLNWRWYLHKLHWYFGNHVTLHRMLPDGTFEPWEVVND